MFKEIIITAELGTGELSEKMDQLTVFKNFILLKSVGNDHYFLMETRYSDSYKIYSVDPGIGKLIN